MTELAIAPMVDERVAALRDAVGALLRGYDEIARMLPEQGAPPEIIDELLLPLQQAAKQAAEALALTAP